MNLTSRADLALEVHALEHAPELGVALVPLLRPPHLSSRTSGRCSIASCDKDGERPGR
jgi:hypothetical protein